MTPTITCPHCKREHALSYWIDAKGRKSLTYVCDRHPVHNTRGTMVDKHGGQAIQMRYSTTRVTVEKFVDGLDIPEEWSKGYAQKQRKARELQLLMPTTRKDK